MDKTIFKKIKNITIYQCLMVNKPHTKPASYHLLAAQQQP